jgi:RNA polymerase sigma factor (sigma-70 family)
MSTTQTLRKADPASTGNRPKYSRRDRPSTAEAGDGAPIRTMSSPDPDLDDLERWRNGDSAAGNRLATKYVPQVYKFFNRKIDGDVADLVQATFLACTEAKGRFRGNSSFRSFLLGIAGKKLLEHYTRLKHPTRNPVDFSVTSLADLGLTPTQLIHGKQYARLVFEAMRQIPIERQLLLELHYWEELTIREMAEIYQINVDTMSSRVRKAREVLEAKLAELVSDPVALASTIHTLDDLIRELHEQAIARFPGLSGRSDV